MKDYLERFQKALDSNNIDEAIICARDLQHVGEAYDRKSYGAFRAKNDQKISCVSKTLTALHNEGEVGNEALFRKRIVEFWEEIDNDCK